MKIQTRRGMHYITFMCWAPRFCTTLTLNCIRDVEKLKTQSLMCITPATLDFALDVCNLSFGMGCNLSVLQSLKISVKICSSDNSSGFY